VHSQCSNFAPIFIGTHTCRNGLRLLCRGSQGTPVHRRLSHPRRAAGRWRTRCSAWRSARKTARR
jgi:hypothetical protein